MIGKKDGRQILLSLGLILLFVLLIPGEGTDKGCQFVHSAFWSILVPKDKQKKTLSLHLMY